MSTHPINWFWRALLFVFAIYIIAKDNDKQPAFTRFISWFTAAGLTVMAWDGVVRL